MTLSGVYADFVQGLNYEALPEVTKAQTKKLVLDLVGVALAGYKLMDFPKLTVGYISELGGKPEATAIGASSRLPAPSAALANATCAHALDMDDGHRFAALHPGVVIIPAALAAAEAAGSSTKDLLAGITAGYEVMIRIGRAVNPSSLNRGFHATGITGVFGAASAAARVTGLSKDQICGALGLAGLQASGILQVNHDTQGARVKPINPAKAAQSGIYAAALAQRGAKGPAEIFEGEDGFFRAFSDQVDSDAAVEGLGKEFEIDNSYLKLYAACRHAHAALDALLEAWPLDGNPEEIEEILVETYPAAIRLAGIPEPDTASAARFSIQLTLALGIKYRDAGADRYTGENTNDPTLRSLARKVRLVASERWEKLYPHKRGATVTINARGKRFSGEVELAKGEPENPASWEEVSSKFMKNCSLALPPDEAEALARTIGELDQVDLAALTKPLGLIKPSCWSESPE
ncbi:MAG: MmgE/PrpD family protein [Desulfobacteraceae bacterium]